MELTAETAVAVSKSHCFDAIFGPSDLVFVDAESYKMGLGFGTYFAETNEIT